RDRGLVPLLADGPWWHGAFGRDDGHRVVARRRGSGRSGRPSRAVPGSGPACRRGGILVQRDRGNHGGPDRNRDVAAPSRKKGAREGVVGQGQGAGSCQRLAAKRCFTRSSTSSTGSSTRPVQRTSPSTSGAAGRAWSGPTSS